MQNITSRHRSNYGVDKKHWQLGELVKKPNYVSGMTQSVYKFIYDLIPVGQIIQMQYGEFLFIRAVNLQ